jgi:ankyrin repeat protein
MDPFSSIEHDDYNALKIIKHDPSLCQQINRYGYTPLEWAYLLGKTKAAGLLETRTPKMLKIDLGEGIKKITPSEFPHFFEVSYYPHLQFNSPKFLEQKLHEAPWMIVNTPVGYAIRQDGIKYRLEIGTGYVADTVIKWIDDEIGYGLFAGIDYFPNTYIAEYTGIVRQIQRLHKDLNSYCFHYPTRCFSWNYTVIDSINQGNESRFINHSDTPNLQPRWLYDRGLMHLTFFSNQFIPKGTQLTFNYGKDFWKHRSGKVELAVNS